MVVRISEGLAKGLYRKFWKCSAVAACPRWDEGKMWALRGQAQSHLSPIFSRDGDREKRKFKSTKFFFFLFFFLIIGQERLKQPQESRVSS